MGSPRVFRSDRVTAAPLAAPLAGRLSFFSDGATTSRLAGDLGRRVLFERWRARRSLGEGGRPYVGSTDPTY